MIIKTLPPSKMRNVDNVCFEGRDYVIRRRYHIAYKYTFKGRTFEEAKAALLAKDGFFGFNTTHASRPHDFFTPASPDNIILRPDDRNSAECVLYFSNSPQHTALLDAFEDISIDKKEETGDGCILDVSFNADFYVTLPDCIADDMWCFDGYKTENIPPAEEWIEKELARNISSGIHGGEDISYLYSVPYTYPCREKFWPWQESEPDDVHLEIVEAIPLEEGIATCFYDSDIVEEFQNTGSGSLMR